MLLEQFSYLAQIAGSVGVIVSLIFVGLQIKQNTRALERNEHNSTMASAKNEGFIPGFVSDVDAMLTKGRAPEVTCHNT